MSQLPKRFVAFMEEFPAVGAAYDSLGKAVKESGPLDAKTQALVKVGIATGAKLEGGIKSHVRRAVEAGASREEIRQVVMLSTTTIGFPGMMTALSAADDVLDKN